MSVPSGLRFTKSDEWIKVDGNVGTVGITDFAQDQLSDIVFVEVTVAPGDIGKKRHHLRDHRIGESSRRREHAGDRRSSEVNESLPDTPELLNSDPFQKAWLLKIELANPAELDSLMDAPAYEKYLQERSH